MNTIKMTSATDKDAAYVLGKIREADRLDTEAQRKTEAAAAARIEAGQRLIEVRAGMASSGQRACPEFARWLNTNGIAPATATRLMQNAGFTEEQRTDAKAKEAERKRVERAAKPKAATTVIQNELHTPVGGTQKRKLAAAGVDLDAKLEEGSAEAAAVVAKAKAILHPAEVKQEIAQERAALPETMQQKFDRLLAKALEAQRAEQDKAFWKAVDAKVKERIPQDLEEARACVREYTAKLKGVPGHLLMEDYRFLLRVLHPDREPTAAERAQAFTIVSKLDVYMRASTR